MGLNAGRAFLSDVTWEEFENEFYGEYPVMKTIIHGGVGFVIMKLIGSGVSSNEGQFERQGTYGNLKFRHLGLGDKKKSHPTKRWATKPSGKYSMKMSVGDYLIDRRDNGGREYNIYIYPPDYTKNSKGEPWIGAYMTGVDGFAAERAIKFAVDAIREETSKQAVVSAIKKRESSKRVMDMIRKNPALAAKFELVEDNLDPDFNEMMSNESDVEDDTTEMDIVEGSKPLEEMTADELRREIDRLESQQ